MRHIILHSHLFKNAGTSVDHILKENFADRWVTEEFSTDTKTNTLQVENWITSNPNGIAFSSHTMIGPLPRIAGIRIIPVVLLRDPIARIASAYRFERSQTAETWGAKLAKQHGFAGYVHARLSNSGDRQCRNFQTAKLASLISSDQDTELNKAVTAAALIDRIGVLGLVSEFRASMDRLALVIKPHFPSFRWQPVNENASGHRTSNTVSPEMRELLRETNDDDLALLSHARHLLDYTSVAV